MNIISLNDIKFIWFHKIKIKRISAVVINILNWNIVVSNFKLNCYCIHFWTNTLIPSTMG